MKILTEHKTAININKKALEWLKDDRKVTVEMTVGELRLIRIYTGMTSGSPDNSARGIADDIYCAIADHPLVKEDQPKENPPSTIYFKGDIWGIPLT